MGWVCHLIDHQFHLKEFSDGFLYIQLVRLQPTLDAKIFCKAYSCKNKEVHSQPDFVCLI